MTPEAADAAVIAGVGAYCDRIRRYRTMPELDIWYDGMHVDSLISYFEPATAGRFPSISRRSGSAAPAAARSPS